MVSEQSITGKMYKALSQMMALRYWIGYHINPPDEGTVIKSIDKGVPAHANSLTD